MNALRWSVLAVSLALLPGCATQGARLSADRVNFEEHPVAEVEAGRCGVRACVLAEPAAGGWAGSIQRIVTGGLGKQLSSVVVRPNADPDHCDVGVRFDNMNVGDRADVVSAYSGEFLFRVEANFQRIGGLICRALQPGTAHYAKLPGEAMTARLAAGRRPSPAAAPAAPAAAISAEQLAQIAAAAAKINQAQAAPAAPAALPLASPGYRAPERPDDLAVVVGVESYADLPKAPYAERDAEAVKAHFRALGVPERNIVHLAGNRAVKSALEKNLELWLPRMVKPDSRVYFYFSGHGAPDVKNGQAYLMPWDGDPNFLDATAYPVKRLYEKLAALPAKHVLVAMDACFSGAGGRSVLASGARPLVTKVETGSVGGRVTALTASAANEISGSLDERQHGAFTWFLLQGLNGAAQDEQGRVTAASLHRYLTPKVQDEARRLNRDQTPQLLGANPALQLR